MLPLVALLFLAIPVIEIAVFIQVGGAIGVWNTIALVILTAVLGIALLRHQGLTTMTRVQESLARNTFPATELFDGACLLLAGALLLTPGFVTDVLGLLLFVPLVRRLLRDLIWRGLRRGSRTRVWVDGETTTIEGEWHEVEPRRGEDGRHGPPHHRLGPRDEHGKSPWYRR